MLIFGFSWLVLLAVELLVAYEFLKAQLRKR
jgi:hypothetical protein